MKERRTVAWSAAALGTFLMIFPVFGLQEGNPKPEPAPFHPKVDQKRVDEAIRKGVEYLKRSGSPG